MFIFLLLLSFFGLENRESVALTTRHPLSAKVGINFGHSVGIVGSRTEVTEYSAPVLYFHSLECICNRSKCLNDYTNATTTYTYILLLYYIIIYIIIILWAIWYIPMASAIAYWIMLLAFNGSLFMWTAASKIDSRQNRFSTELRVFLCRKYLHLYYFVWLLLAFCMFL
jgi:hypothetical protein